MDAQIHALDPNAVGHTRDTQRNAQKTEISSDFQTFLRMLTTQMQNQNPLEPIEASDFAVQLATFSGVEQQVRTNDLLAQMGARMGLSELANWVGREALTSAPQLIDGAVLRLVPPDTAGADRAELVLRDRDGNEAGRYAVSPGATELILDIPDPGDGGPGTGYYEMTMESFKAGDLIGAEPVLGYSRIVEARSDAGQVLLVLDGGHIIASDMVVGLRE